MSLEGKVAFVTGAASGMGRLLSRNMARAGARVAAVDLDEAGLAKTAEGNPGIECFSCDVTNPGALEAVAKQVETELGPIDRVFAAAAIMPSGRLLDQDLGTIHRIMDINYGGVVNTVRSTLPAMIERGHGDMVIFASMAGWQPVLLLGAYNASKFAVVSFSEVLLHENRNSGIRFACVCPPPVNTPLLNQAKDARPKIFDAVETLEPQSVLDAIEKTLADGSFWVFPGKTTRMGWRFRRWFPKAGWKQIHKIEGW